MLLAADDVTLTQFLNANWGTIAAMLAGLGTAIAAAATWLTRVVWVIRKTMRSGRTARCNRQSPMD